MRCGCTIGIPLHSWHPWNALQLTTLGLLCLGAEDLACSIGKQSTSMRASSIIRYHGVMLSSCDLVILWCCTRILLPIIHDPTRFFCLHHAWHVTSLSYGVRWHRHMMMDHQMTKAHDATWQTWHTLIHILHHVSISSHLAWWCNMTWHTPIITWHDMTWHTRTWHDIRAHDMTYAHMTWHTRIILQDDMT